MNMATHHFTILLFMILSTSMVAMMCMAQVVINDIFDTDADILQTGKPYHILPVVQRRGGGISATQTCPISVVQETSTSALGIPVTFYRQGSSAQNVTFSLDMNVVFGPTNTCGESPVWTVKLDDSTGDRYVGLGGKRMARGPTFVNSWFRIERFFERFHFDYKLVFCPTRTICPTCEVTCGDLGVVIQADGTWRLAVGASPLRIKFQKA